MTWALLMLGAITLGFMIGASLEAFWSCAKQILGSESDMAKTSERVQPVLPGMFGQPSMGFVVPGQGPHHDGATYAPTLDHQRLNAQALRVWYAMRDGAWWTLAGLAECTGDPEASVSARMRDLRKPQFGGHQVDRRRVGDSGVFQYRLTANPITGDRI
jgi:hypothetical protein